MLEPHNRRLLLESLRPPRDFAFDCAIGTTFSLDLLALLTAPIAFTLFDAEGADTPAKVDLLAVLGAVRRHIDNVAIFCQMSQIRPPGSDPTLCGYLEDAVVEVSPRNGRGVFHPEVWVLRYKRGDMARYRLLCLSRNLTFDRSWDTVLVLEGELLARKNALATNHPLGHFLSSLPKMAVGPLKPRIVEIIDRIQSEVRRVRFEAPEGFEKVVFWPIGIRSAATWPFENVANHSVIVSPFLSDSCLRRLAPSNRGHILISRQESLDALPDAELGRFDEVYVMNEATSPEPTDGDAGLASDEVLDGLHAKLYVVDDGWNAHVWTGSANATEAAFNGNIEFLVELVGKKSKCGADALLKGGVSENSLMDLLVKYARPANPLPIDQSKQQLEKLLEQIIRDICAASLSATIEASDGGDFSLRLSGKENVTARIKHRDAKITFRCWPITFKEGAAVEVRDDLTGIDFGRISLEAITAFFVFDVKVERNDAELSRRFVVKMPLEGAPEDRREHILRTALSDRARVTRFLLLLLSEDSLESVQIANAAARAVGGIAGDSQQGLALPLFEFMVRAFDQDPAKLDRIADVVGELRRAPEGTQLLPLGFDEVWAPIWTARQSERQRRPAR